MVPVLLLTGFLGSGKTTLLNRLLDERPEGGVFGERAGKLALIVNEFGDVGIDGDLLPDEMTRQIEIKGGCICCRLDEDLEKTLNELLQSRDDLGAIVIETTGIAEPLPISWTLARDELNEKLRLAAVVATIDGVQHMAHQTMSPSVDAQVEYADVFVLNKCALSSESKLSEIEASVRKLNEQAPMIRDDESGYVRSLWAILEDPELPQSDRPESAATLERSPQHDFESVNLEIPGLIDFEILAEELEGLPPEYLRIKGIAEVIDEGSGTSERQWVAFHRVGARVSAEPISGKRQARIVAIGRSLEKSRLERCITESIIDER